MGKNTGLLVCNDFNVSRLPSLVGNIQRMGVRNAVVSHCDGRKLGQNFSKFDRILLDAPCSGMGVISKDPSIKIQRTRQDILTCSQLQRQLLLAAIDMVSAWNGSKKSGVVVYSTCSITLEE